MNKISNSKYGIVLSVLPLGSLPGKSVSRFHASNLYSFEILPTIHSWTGNYRLFNQELNDILLSSCEIINLELTLDCNDAIYGLTIVRTI